MNRHLILEIRLFLLLGCLHVLGGCASASLEVGVTTRAETYSIIEDRMGLLTSEPPKCAVIPVIMGSTGPSRGVAANLAFDKAMSRDDRPFSLTAREKAEPYTVVANDVVMNYCIEVGRLDTLRSLMSTVQPGNSVDPKFAKEMGEILNVEYLFVPQIAGLKTDNAGRFTFAGLTFIRTGWISVEGTLQLWHAPTGRLVWQSAGEGSLTAENVVGISPPAQAAFDALFSTLVDDFISGRSESVVSGKVTAPPSANPTNTNAAGNSPRDQSVQSAAQTLETGQSDVSKASDSEVGEGEVPTVPRQNPVTPAPQTETDDS